jgi:hypothetical protein
MLWSIGRDNGHFGGNWYLSSSSSGKTLKKKAQKHVELLKITPVSVYISAIWGWGILVLYI